MSGITQIAMCSLWFIGFTFLLLCNGSFASPRIDPLVETKVGLIRGLSASDGDYSMFLGIPFGVVNETNPFGVSYFEFINYGKSNLFVNHTIKYDRK